MDAEQPKDTEIRYLGRVRRFGEGAVKRESDEVAAISLAVPELELELEHELTKRESEVLQLIAEGFLNREIGARLIICEDTVKSHVCHLLRKLQARSRAHAVAIGFRRGLIPNP